MKKKGIILAAAILVAAAFLSMILIVYSQDNKYGTYTALAYSAQESVSVTGVFLREEISQPVDGDAIWYLVDDGEKVANGQGIAGIYSTDGEVAAARQLELIQAELKELKASQRQSISDAGSAVTADGYLAQIKKYNSLIYTAAAGGDAALAAEYRGKLNGLLNSYYGCFESVDYATGIAALEAEIADLQTQIGASKTKRSTASGYFYSYSDAMIDVNPAEVLEKLNAQSVSELVERAMHTEKSVGGKLVTGYRWYYVFTVPTETAVLLAGSKLTMCFPAVSDLQIAVTVEKMVMENGSYSYCVSAINDISELGGCRLENAEIIISSVSGLRVPVKALRTEVDSDGVEQTGVYVAVGPIMEFRKVNVLLNEGDYAVCENPDKSGWLRLYDEVIIKGKNLYDGKTM